MSYRFLQYRSKRFPAGRVGLVNADGTQVTPINFPNGRPVVDLKVLIRDWDAVASSLLPSHAVEAISSVEILAPVTGRDIICVGKNYLEHAREFQQSGWDGSSKDDIPKHPVVFTKRATSIIGTNQPIHPHPNVTTKLDYEGELAIIVGKGGRNIKKQDAWEHVWGACVLNDVTARDRQRDHIQFFLGKSLDTFCPMGPYAVHSSNLDWQNMTIETRVNGQLRQRANASDLIFDIPTLIETCSAGITLQPGDVIATGTPVGTGMGQSPQVFLQPGDVVEVEITGLGKLSNVVARPNTEPVVQLPLEQETGELSYLADSNLLRLKSGLNLHVEVLNPDAQQTIIFIHGLGGSSTNFAAVIQAAGLAETYRVVSFDFEGHGLSPLSGNGSTSVEGYVASVAEVLDSVGADKATVVGHSLGGLIATTFAAKHASRVDKLILLGPVKKMAPGGVDALTKRAETVRSGGMSAIVDAVSTAGCSTKTNSSRPLSKAAVRASLLASQPEGYAQACLALAHADDPDYSAITAPTLIVAGSEDKTSPQATIDFLSGAITGAKVAKIEDVGHWHQVEDVDAVAREIRTFVKTAKVNGVNGVNGVHTNGVNGHSAL
ncbi:hypothetical protein NBRC10512_005635 [Rhodotorula toruloides]|uniref:RHTO0S15e00936g1_1 n=2 Tax=Rhodotorula toruloides TaxID=5286 RepID=A0A061BKX9_RHOTO|nr:fumarylacetoacetate hydrolase [Rhodotorula toruloides NP11]EMS25535.1 fumarylacetoacetate hydrolase [Rhodotorula toruloides NP11]CDR47719.1 RHTO0S15e00936g1_1 [Rhodotorula toruloides]